MIRQGTPLPCLYVLIKDREKSGPSVVSGLFFCGFRRLSIILTGVCLSAMTGSDRELVSGPGPEKCDAIIFRLQAAGQSANTSAHEHFAHSHQRLVVGSLKAATQAFAHMRSGDRAAGIIRAAFLFGCSNEPETRNYSKTKANWG